jgi:hypothetical protein
VKDRHTQHRNVNLSLVQTTTTTTHVIPGLLSTALGPADILTVFQMDGLNWLCDSLVSLPIRWAWYASPISIHHFFLLMFNFTRGKTVQIVIFLVMTLILGASVHKGYCTFLRPRNMDICADASFVSDFRGLSALMSSSCLVRFTCEAVIEVQNWCVAFLT